MRASATAATPKAARSSKKKGARKSAKKEPCARERMAEAAEMGDIHELLRLMRENRGISILETRDYADGEKLIPRALEKLRSNSAADLVECLLTEIMYFEARLYFRARHQVENEIEEFDRQRPMRGELPDRVSKQWLPRIHGIQESIERTARTMATVIHTLRLSDAQAAKRGDGPRIVPLHAKDEEAQETGEASYG